METKQPIKMNYNSLQNELVFCKLLHHRELDKLWCHTRPKYSRVCIEGQRYRLCITRFAYLLTYSNGHETLIRLREVDECNSVVIVKILVLFVFALIT